MSERGFLDVSQAPPQPRLDPIRPAKAQRAGYDSYRAPDVYHQT